MAFGKGPGGNCAGVPGQLQRLETGRPQVLVQYRHVGSARHIGPHHVAGTLHRIGRNRQPAGQGLQRDQAKGVGAAGEDKDLADGIARVRASLRRLEFYLRYFRPAPSGLPSPTTTLVPGIQGQEGLIFFLRYPSDMSQIGP